MIYEGKEKKQNRAVLARAAARSAALFLAAAVFLAPAMPLEAKGLDGLRKLNESGESSGTADTSGGAAAESTGEEDASLSGQPGEGTGLSSDAQQSAGDSAAASGELEKQKAYLREAISRLRELGITPDIILADVRDLLSHSSADNADDGDTLENADNSADGGSTAENADYGTGDGTIVENVSEESTSDVTADEAGSGLQEAGQSLQSSLQEAGENAKSTVDQKVNEAAQSARSSAEETATNAVHSFFDSLSAKIQGIFTF